jgi:hypothetical protein
MAVPVYVPHNLRWHEDQLDERFNALGGINDNTLVRIIIMIDYAFHSALPNYDDGLTIFNRLNQKIGKYADEEIEEIKDSIRNDPTSYINEMENAWTIDELWYYGI